MNRVHDIESEVRKLSSEALKTLRHWFHQFDSDNWDRQIEADARVVRPDPSADEALRQHSQGDTSELCSTAPRRSSGSS